tara:strand:+ start:369 stop:986 length:618 start_codon:yes stop_codon:yes gene_type:complete
VTVDDESGWDDDEFEEGPEPVVIDLRNEGLIAWVDQEDAALAKFAWSAKQAGTKEYPHYYAYRNWTVGSARGEYWLHTEVWERAFDTKLPEGFLVDHINGDKQDNRRSNLRLATRADNEANKKKRRTQAGGQPSSQWKGVTEVKDGRKKKWRATLTFEKKNIALGYFHDELDAAYAYNVAALEYYGEFAGFNELPDSYVPPEERK